MQAIQDGIRAVELLTYIELTFFHVGKRTFTLEQDKKNALYLINNMKRMIEEELVYTPQEAREELRKLVKDENILEELASTMALGELASLKMRLEKHFATYFYQKVKSWAESEHLQTLNLSNSRREYENLYKGPNDIALLGVLFGEKTVAQSPLLSLRSQFHFAMLFTAEFTLSIIPGVGAAVAIIEIIEGETLLTKKKLSTFEKILAGLGALAEVFTISRAVRKTDPTGSAMEEIQRALNLTSDDLAKLSPIHKSEMDKVKNAINLLSQEDLRRIKKYARIIRKSNGIASLSSNQLKDMRRLLARYRMYLLHQEELMNITRMKRGIAVPVENQPKVTKFFYDYGDSPSKYKGQKRLNIEAEIEVAKILTEHKGPLSYFGEIIRVPDLSPDRVRKLMNPELLEQAKLAGKESKLIGDTKDGMKMGDYILDRNTTGDVLNLGFKYPTAEAVSKSKHATAADFVVHKIAKKVYEKGKQANILFVVVDNLTPAEFMSVLSKAEAKLWDKSISFRNEVTHIFWMSIKRREVISISRSPDAYQLSSHLKAYEVAVMSRQYTEVFKRSILQDKE